jgi:SEC-C motif-containing protein
METCPCGLEQSYEECCGALISGAKQAETAEQLMRSRYSAYAKVEMEYVRDTTHPDVVGEFDMKDSTRWAESSNWQSLEIVETEKGGTDDETGIVEFVATYEQKGKYHKHHERSTFKKVDGKWFFEDGHGVKPKQFIRKESKVRPNDPCPCGSGRKHKKCCMYK